MIGLEPLAEVLCLGYLGQGRNHVILEYLSEASNMSILMGLFVLRVGMPRKKRRSCLDWLTKKESTLTCGMERV